MHFDLITIFPDMLESYFSKGMIRIAQEKKLIKIKTHDLRQFAVDKHGTVDDRPYGGGPGQVLMVEPVYKALKQLSNEATKQRSNETMKQPTFTTSSVGKRNKKIKIVLLSARGKKWDQQMAQKFSKLDQVIFVCPRYEGHDERIRKFVDEEISIGDFILTGGELAAAVIIDSVTRLIPGVLGKQESLRDESHSKPGYLEYPQYTRPEVFEFKTCKTSPAKLCGASKTSKLKVPMILLSGHHANIAEWRNKHEKLNS